MILSESGQIAKTLWQELPEHFSFVSLDEYIIMPDHVHGIIIINPCADDDVIDVETLHATSHPKSIIDTVETLHATSLRQQRQPPSPIRTPKNTFMSTISPKPGSLASVIRSYKSAVTRNAHLTIHGFSWQPRYYDHLIRSDSELERIKKYIIDNPIYWRPM